jgi:hypothetical protein
MFAVETPLGFSFAHLYDCITGMTDIALEGHVRLPTSFFGQYSKHRKMIIPDGKNTYVVAPRVWQRSFEAIFYAKEPRLDMSRARQHIQFTCATATLAEVNMLVDIVACLWRWDFLSHSCLK